MYRLRAILCELYALLGHCLLEYLCPTAGTSFTHKLQQLATVMCSRSELTTPVAFAVIVSPAVCISERTVFFSKALSTFAGNGSALSSLLDPGFISVLGRTISTRTTPSM